MDASGGIPAVASGFQDKVSVRKSVQLVPLKEVVVVVAVAVAVVKLLNSARPAEPRLQPGKGRSLLHVHQSTTRWRLQCYSTITVDSLSMYITMLFVFIYV